MRGARSAMLLAVAACAPSPARPGNPEAEITALLVRSAADWNRGDLAGFMSDYAHDSAVSYVSGGQVRYGWQPLYDHYRDTYFAPGKSRDSLTFDSVRVHPLTGGFAFCTARFTLMRRDSVTASGLFTLILEQRGGRWYILHDHTSADPK